MSGLWQHGLPAHQSGSDGGITNGDKLLLTKYNGREYKKYALVAGFNEIGESLRRLCAVRSWRKQDCV